MIIKLSVLTLISLLMLGCLNVKDNKLNTNIPSNRLVVKIKDIHRKDSLEYGEIIYKSPIMDTLKLGKDDKRYLWFHFGIYDKQQNIKELEGQTSESYKAISDSVIPFDSRYNKTGVYYLDGYIEEVFLLSEYDKGGNMRKIGNFIKVSKKIKVIE